MTAQAKTPADETAQALLERGLAAHDAGDASGAEALFRAALALEPDDPTALYLLGLARFQAGAAAEAETLIARLAGLRPDHAQAQFTLASIRHWRDDRAAAIAGYRKTLELDAGHVAALIGLARALSETGDHAAALQAAASAVAKAPDEALAHMALAAAWRGLGEVLKAADAFRQAAALAPDLVAAHVGLSLALSDAGEAEAARAAAEQATALAPDLCDAWLALGTALRGVHDPAAAADAFERALAIEETRSVAHLNLGLALIELERAAEARAHLNRTLELDPTSAKAHANLSSLYYLAGRKDLAKAHAERALAIEPDLMSAHQNLAALLAEEQRPDEARVHRDRAYATRNLIVTTAARPRRRVLVLSTTESGNTPDRHLIPPVAYTRLLWFIEYASEAQMAGLPPYDIAFNAVGDEDLAGPTAANAARFAEICPARLLNHPAKIARTRRDLAGELLGRISGVCVPRTVRVSAAEVAGGVRAAAASAGIEGAFLVRPIGSHGGKGLVLAGGDAADEPLLPARAYYLTEFHDFRSADGLFRKYRAIFVERRPLPYHLAIAERWMVHYEHSGMERHPGRLAEEMRYLEDPATALGAAAWGAVGAIGAALGLDYAGVDFSVLPDGRVLVFEANATMLVHPEAPDGPLAHKNPAIERILAAFREMLAT
ncbi:MAG TPA: tetratricopeptide repeat protein [Caulobacteraceae bacterium]|nr:tetratricopeptide repeat protein [Caulobacteraceae bacterium]